MNSFGKAGLRKALRLGSEAGWVLFGQVGMAAGALFAVKILTHFLSPFEFGRLALASTLILSVANYLFGPISQGFMRFWSIAVDRGETRAFRRQSRRILIRVTGFVLLLSALSFLPVSGYMGVEWAALVLLAALVGVCSGWTATRQNVLMAARKRKVVALTTTAVAFMKPLMGVLFVVLFKPNSVWVVAGYLLVTFAGLHLIEHYYNENFPPEAREPDPEEEGLPGSEKLGKEIFAFAMPFFVWGAFSWAHESCDRWALQFHYGADVVGAFAVVSQLAVYPLILTCGFLSMLFVPIVYQGVGSLASGEAFKTANRLLLVMTSIYAAAACLLVLVYVFLHQQIVLIVSNRSYAGLSHLLPGLTTAWGLFYLGQTLTGYGMLANKPRVYILPKITAAVFAVVLTFSLPLWYGPAGVMWALGAAGLLYAAWCWVIAWRLGRRLELSPSELTVGPGRYPRHPRHAAGPDE